MAQRLERMMQQCRMGERLRGDAGTAAEFDGQSRCALAMCLLGGMVEAHRVNTIWRDERHYVKVQIAL